MKKFLVLLLGLALVLTFAACGASEEPAEEAPAEEEAASGMTVTVITADGEIEVDVAGQEVSDKEFQATSSTGETKDMSVTGFDLIAFLEAQGVDLSGVTSYTLAASDGYSNEVAAADLTDGLWLCTANKGEALETVMSAVPGGTTGAMVKDLLTVTLNYGEADADAAAAAEGEYVPVDAPSDAITMNEGDEYFVKVFVGDERKSMTIDQVMDIPAYDVTLTKTNKEGVSDTMTYTGFKWDDFLSELDMTADDVTSVTFVCSDGYEADVQDLSLLNADGSILAYLGDGQQINEGAGYLWFCTNEGFGSNWCKFVEKIIINDAD